ncbi:uncharacterized protein RAG0_12458 [Rhynchosporium agropyri]|uniref:Uncharacterized protein n=1 Tax=Rhynchosporium agropyri TaxID=914238 RepID=A0A1E1L8I5_9HELO|nr:uncharacterized protein RAG0_12458 [Rhynchosporium agropyri]
MYLGKLLSSESVYCKVAIMHLAQSSMAVPTQLDAPQPHQQETNSFSTVTVCQEPGANVSQ